MESVKQTVSEREGKTFSKFNAISYKSQVVAGKIILQFTILIYNNLSKVQTIISK